MNGRLQFAMLVGILVNSVVAQDFVIENEILVKDEVVQKGWTIFSGQQIIDIQIPDKNVREPNITVFSTDKKEFRVLSPKLKKQSAVTISRLRSMAAEMSVMAKKSQPFIQFAANPKFRVSLSDKEQKLMLRSDIWTYTATKNEHPDAAKLADRYKSFADAFANFNCLASPVPPNARLELNRRMAESNMFPGVVTLSIPKSKIRRMSRHTIHPTLSAAHKQIVNEANAGMVSYRLVTIDKFWPNLVAQRPGQKRR